MDLFTTQIERIQEGPHQTLGVWEIPKHNFACNTLELPDKDNQRRISCIPVNYEGYTVVKRWSKKYKWHFHITDVPNRDWILIHAANYVRQLRGCIGAGSEHAYLDNDKHLDIKHSKQTIQNLLDILDISQYY